MSEIIATVCATARAQNIAGWIMKRAKVLNCGVFASIPTFQSRKMLGEQLGIPVKAAYRIIDERLELNILQEVRGRIVCGPRHIHLGNESSQIVRHHTNWRISTVQRLARGNKDDLHYSLAFSCSPEDAQRIPRAALATVRKDHFKIGRRARLRLLF